MAVCGGGVELICAVLSEHGVKFAPSSYYNSLARKPSSQDLRDEVLKVEIERAHRESYRVNDLKYFVGWPY